MKREESNWEGALIDRKEWYNCGDDMEGTKY
jgi:hypothetical protein